MEINILTDILLNENASFLKNTEKVKLSKATISEIFSSCSSVKSGRYLAHVIKEKWESENDEITFSFCAFKYESKPSMLNISIETWKEVKIAYLLIIEIGDYIIISKKNISGLHRSLKSLDRIGHNILTVAFTDKDTKYERVGIRNLDSSDKAMRSKSLEALDLKDSISPFGANQYKLNGVQISTLSHKLSIAFNSSKINKLGVKTHLPELFTWAKSVVTLIDSYQPKENFLSIFAESVDYPSLQAELIPISVLLNFDLLYKQFENAQIAETFIRTSVKGEIVERKIDLLKYLGLYETLLEVKQINSKFFLNNAVARDFELKLNKKTITLKSGKLEKIILKMDNGNDVSLMKIINANNSSMIYFDSADLVYTNRSLFRDNRLLGNIDIFLQLFKPFKELEEIVNEKGFFSKGQSAFTPKSLFHFVENTFSEDASFFICDDMSKEWADHIALTDKKITFYHSKCSKSKFSASDFQEIVGQAKKNLGNMFPDDSQLEFKSGIWNRNYNQSKIKTSIKRIRKGSNAKDAILQFKETIRNPYTSKEVYLLINFISKSVLEKNLAQLKAGISFKERHETIQILWFISSLNASCREMNTDLYICCKP